MLVRFDPFAELSRLQGDFARFDGALRPHARGDREAAFQPAVDIYEGKDAIFVKAELPGVFTTLGLSNASSPITDGRHPKSSRKAPTRRDT